MPALIPTDCHGTVTWLGRVADRGAALASAPLDQVMARFTGLDGEAHGGLTRPSCSRVTAQHALGTEIRNCRQLTILSAEDLALIAADMGLDALDPGLLGASMVIAGLPDFSHLPPSARLQTDSGATLVVDMQNYPCTLPAPGIEAAHPGKGARFKPAAKDRRGVTAWVEREGILRIGDRLRLHIPDQRPWAHRPVMPG